jgi:hypothetical protein
VKRTTDDIKARSPNHVLRIQQNGGRLVVIEISRHDNGNAVWSCGCTLDARIGRSLALHCNDRRETWTLSRRGQLLSIERTVPGCDSCVPKELRFKKAIPHRQGSTE